MVLHAAETNSKKKNVTFELPFTPKQVSLWIDKHMGPLWEGPGAIATVLAEC